MARVAGVDLPKNKRIDVALQYLYGVGETRAKSVLEKLSGSVKPDTRVKDLTEEQVVLINNLLTKDFKVEGDLRREQQANISRLTEIGSYRGHRHRRSLPARGQRTKTNARTRRGRRKTVGVGKSASPTGKA
ncbi:MAG: 30S ribosomal protein S13 [Elusimicrobiota bacterium]|nr:MAG: 30S ribosomal protein S13 [Elusimicrobiota bacterium]